MHAVWGKEEWGKTNEVNKTLTKIFRCEHPYKDGRVGARTQRI